MTKKDYELIARQFELELAQWKSNLGPVFGTEAVKAIEELGYRLATKLTLENPKFDGKRFLKACSIK